MQRNWVGAFAKLSLLHLSLQGYERLLYMDVDGTILRSPDALFALPFAPGVSLYGMRDLYTCTASRDTDSLMSSFFLWNTGANSSRQTVEYFSLAVDAMFSSFKHRGTVPSNQKLMSLIFGSRMRFLDEDIATNVFRCACKRENNGVESLNQTIYAHFMSVVLNLQTISEAVLHNTTYKWAPSTLFSSHVPDCAGPAYRSWIEGLTESLGLVPEAQRVLQFTLPQTCPETVPECVPFSQTTVLNVKHRHHLFDGDLVTVAQFSSAGHNDFIIIYLTIIQQYQMYERVEVVFADAGTKVPKLGIDFTFLFDDITPSSSGLLARKGTRSITIKFIRHVSYAFGIKEIVLVPMQEFSVELLQKVASSNNQSAESPFARGQWQPIHVDGVLSDKQQQLQSIVDGDVKSSCSITRPSTGMALAIELQRVFSVCGFDVLAGTHDNDLSGDGLANDMLFGNDGALVFGKVTHATQNAVRFKQPLKLFNLFLVFSGHVKWLRLREIRLLHAQDIGAHQQCPSP